MPDSSCITCYGDQDLVQLGYDGATFDRTNDQPAGEHCKVCTRVCLSHAGFLRSYNPGVMLIIVS